MKRSALILTSIGLATFALAQGGGPESRVGKPLPKFTMTTTKGQKLTNASVKGKVVLLDFWATWCGPCKAAAPTIQKLHQTYGSKGLMAIGADVLEQGAKNTAAPYAKKHGYTYTFSENNDKLASALGITGIPVFVLVDKKGIVRNVWQGFKGEADLYAKIEKAVKPLLK